MPLHCHLRLCHKKQFVIKDRFQKIIKDRFQNFDIFNMFQTTEQPMVTEQAEEGQGETSPGDTHDHVDEEDATPLPFEAVSQETVCH